MLCFKFYCCLNIFFTFTDEFSLRWLPIFKKLFPIFQGSQPILVSGSCNRPPTHAGSSPAGHWDWLLSSLDYPYFQTLNSSQQFQIGHKYCVYMRIPLIKLGTQRFASFTIYKLSFLNFVNITLSYCVCKSINYIFSPIHDQFCHLPIHPVTALLIVCCNN